MMKAEQDTDKSRGHISHHRMMMSWMFDDRSDMDIDGVKNFEFRFDLSDSIDCVLRMR